MKNVDLGWIREGLKKPGKTQTGLAAALGRAPSMATDLLNGRRSLKVSEVEAIAAYLEVEAPPFDVPEVPLLGKIAAGPTGPEFFEDHTLGTAPVPPGWTETTVATVVEGNSMRGIAFHGWYVYYDDRREGIADDMLGEPCAIWLPDGRTVFKIPYRGRGPGLYDLESANPAYDTMRDQRVVWAALVTAIIPRKASGRLSDRTDDVAAA